MPRGFSSPVNQWHRTQGVIHEAIVKFHSSTNPGCERNPPSRGDAAGHGQGEKQHKGLCSTAGVIGAVS